MGKKIKRNIDDKEDKDREDTETDSASDRGESFNENNNQSRLGGLFIKNKNNINKNKKVNFDLENNKIIFFDKEENVSNLLAF